MSSDSHMGVWRAPELPEVAKEDLIPPDPKQCQCMTRGGSFMTFGPRQYVRCPEPPVAIATENAHPNGAMSLCIRCLAICGQRHGDTVTYQSLDDWTADQSKEAHTTDV